MRKLFGSFLMLAWLIGYIAVATVIGDRIASEHWAIKLLYYPIVGVCWILPIKPLIGWMHARDAPTEKPDV